MESVRQFLVSLVEQYPQAVSYTGLGFIAVGLIWMLVLLFSILRRAIVPILLVVVGAVILVGMSWLKDTRPRERVIGGDLALTVTGAEFNYKSLMEMDDLKILHMANPDVTDKTLENLRNCRQLKDLDLSKTQITDEGLAILAQLPLEKLYLENAKNITDVGFEKYLSKMESLLNLNLSGTQVDRALGTEWKKANPKRRLIQ